ncbi:MAG: hypothetical protein R2912_01365 [Eubacteriales bacterium]
MFLVEALGSVRGSKRRSISRVGLFHVCHTGIDHKRRHTAQHNDCQRNYDRGLSVSA